MRYLVRINELQKKIDFMKEKLEIVNDEIGSIELLKNNITWEGHASEVFKEKYNNYIVELKEIQKRLIEDIGFLMSFYSRYEDDYNKLKRQYNNLYDWEDNKNV